MMGLWLTETLALDKLLPGVEDGGWLKSEGRKRGIEKRR
jgi:hypothetical protein